tara:strand:- start:2195 stop:2683 length:489 start_codon:yes stop_codon:yes gene_type:complete
MKKILIINIIFFSLYNVAIADYCSNEQALSTFKYTVLWEETNGNIPKDKIQKQKELLNITYAFGLNIQKAVLDKDMDKIYSYLADKMPFQNKKDFKNKSFDEVFTEEQRDKIISDTVTCNRFNANGWMLGNGIIWYSNYEDLHTDDKNAVAIRALRGLYQGE